MSSVEATDSYGFRCQAAGGRRQRSRAPSNPRDQTSEPAHRAPRSGRRRHEAPHQAAVAPPPLLGAAHPAVRVGLPSNIHPTPQTAPVPDRFLTDPVQVFVEVSAPHGSFLVVVMERSGPDDEAPAKSSARTSEFTDSRRFPADFTDVHADMRTLVGATAMWSSRLSR